MDVLDMFRLDGRCAIVTGGSRGIGKQIALGLAQAGATVLIAGRTESTLDESAQYITKHTGRQCLKVSADVTKPDDVTSLFETAFSHMGSVDILVNNAGMQIRHRVENFPLDDWRAVIDGNLTSAFLCTRTVLSSMIERKYGRIINLGSVMGIGSSEERSAYCAAKAAVHHFTRATAVEVAQHGVTVNAIAPGPVITESNRDAFNDPEIRVFL
jgi:NAD(P)-dependent dehydrogenase (short-subunit alcohol dehydrogenase family)